ncbi:MAG: o-succinylbenzoate synthase [Corynebacterium sp.]|nr:o-succinylbenzoate synthase [Corynebacterium sp.]
MLPTLPDLLDRAVVVSLPMRVRFRGLTHREIMLVEGPNGWCEWSPFVEYETAEAATWLRCTLEMGWDELPAVQRPLVPINATVPAVHPEEIEAILARVPGARTVKVKVAERIRPDGTGMSFEQSLREDVARVNAVRRILPGALIRVDANRGWSVDEAVQAVRVLTANGPLEYVEQPCFSADELGELRARLDWEVPGPGRPDIAADESIRKASDPLTVVGKVDRAVLKAQPMGGVSRLLQVERDLGLTVTVSSALESAVGMYAGLVAAAAQTGPGVSAGAAAHSAPSWQLPAAGLGTGTLFAEDVAPPRPIVDGKLEVMPVIPENFPRPSSPLERADLDNRWRDRLTACWEYLQR